MKFLSDEELIAKYRDGSQDAFNEIYSRYKNLVKYFCRNLYILGAEEVDLIQEGMLGLIKAVNGYQRSEASFKTYLITCVKSSLINAVKRNCYILNYVVDSEKNYYSDNILVFKQ